jgi:hypothetical protein
MPQRTDEYEIPDSWPDKDLGAWVRATMDEPNVKWIRFVKKDGKLVAQVHYQS